MGGLEWVEEPRYPGRWSLCSRGCEDGYLPRGQKRQRRDGMWGGSEEGHVEVASAAETREGWEGEACTGLRMGATRCACLVLA